jgi:hypothetical protein
MERRVVRRILLDGTAGLGCVPGVRPLRGWPGRRFPCEAAPLLFVLSSSVIEVALYPLIGLPVAIAVFVYAGRIGNRGLRVGAACFTILFVLVLGIRLAFPE